MKLKDILNEKIEIDVEIGDTILVGRFKNKKLVVKDIGKDSHGMPTINGRKVTTFRTTKNVNENKEEIKVIHDFLTRYTKSAKKASAMIKKNYKKVKKQFSGDSTRDLAMALIGYNAIGESMTKSQIKSMRDKFKKTGELPPHLKKFVKAKKEFEKKFKVKNIVVPGLEWMADMKEETQKMKKESTEKYKKSLEKIVKDKKLKMLSKKDKETLLKIVQLMKNANN